ncbi:TetR/AcrR family transcriptional regulator [Schaalia hyovaginalis]|uniref:AcrR family transcriptional regulator n=1 Tax=Schaalia hyovaginalis TaxID=29316 RepID=A0A923E207_9ACTO|nr:TetR/AcrR family transcriptional regulator [Schaalia hyovaginalis]MBB6334511.1 AcrR family transcriptional regulator [Schaalia hyovaginalis]MDY2668646.1 helix-turn-helix domain-containing protein [Schaalia hyovaginalis]
MSRTDRTPRRRLDPDARRSALLAAATAAFAAQPYDAVTLAAIAKDAGASPALLYRYFEGKDALYAAVLTQTFDRLAERHDAEIDALDDNTPARDAVARLIHVYLDAVKANPTALLGPRHSGGAEPAAAAHVRAQARTAGVDRLATVLAPATSRRHDIAILGALGFIEAAALTWVEDGCPESDRWPIVEAALGALEGALGDWAA